MTKYLHITVIGLLLLTLVSACTESQQQSSEAIADTQQKPAQGALLLYRSVDNKESLFEWTADRRRITWWAKHGVWTGASKSDFPGITLVADEIWKYYNFTGVFKVERPQKLDFGIIFYALRNAEDIHSSSYYYLHHTSKQLELRKHDEQGDTVLARTSLSLTDAWHDFRVQVRGDRVEYYVDDKRLLTYAGLKHDHGGVGFWFKERHEVMLISKPSVQAFAPPADVQMPDMLQSMELLAAKNSGTLRCGDYRVRWFNHAQDGSRSAPPWMLVTDKSDNILLVINEKKAAAHIHLYPNWCRDILANGVPALSYTRGKRREIVLLQQPLQVLTSDAYRLIPEQLDNTAAMELVDRAVPIILTFDGKNYREATRRYPQVLRAELDKARAKLERTGVEQQKSAVLHALDYYVLLGEPYKGIREIRPHLSTKLLAWLNRAAQGHIADINHRYKRQALAPVQPGDHYASGFPRDKPSIDMLEPIINMPARRREFISLDYVLKAEISEDPVRRHEALLHVIQSWFGPAVLKWTQNAIKQGYMIDELFYLKPEYGKGSKDSGKVFVYAVISGTYAPSQQKMVKVYTWLGSWQGIPPYWLVYDPDQDGEYDRALTSEQVEKIFFGDQQQTR